MADILSADTDDLTGHDIADATIWADRYRDSDRHGSQQRYRALESGILSITPALSTRSISSPPNLPTRQPTPRKG